MGSSPLSYLRTNGPAAAIEARLGWWLLAVSCLVIVVIVCLVLRGSTHRFAEPRTGATLEHDERRGMRWIFVGGLLLPGLILVLTFAFTIGTLSAVAAPARRPAITVRVIGHRWWWEFRYIAGDSTIAVTANELHLPVGEPVALQITSDDVIHSFWVPKLAGKTDAIPGVMNRGWIEADSAGLYRGQCTEYCGQEHANMAVVAVAEPPATFATWLTNQGTDAVVPADSTAKDGAAVFVSSGCATCHTVRGIEARGTVGPDLTHLASRRTIASGTLENSLGNLGGWISNAPELKPGVIMPPMYLTPREHRSLLAYLTELR